jgi:hypothetical protein
MFRFTIRDLLWLMVVVVASIAAYRFGSDMQRAMDDLKLRNAALMVEQAQLRLQREGLPPLYDAMKTVSPDEN